MFNFSPAHFLLAELTQYDFEKLWTLVMRRNFEQLQQFVLFVMCEQAGLLNFQDSWNVGNKKKGRGDLEGFQTTLWG